MTYFVIIAGLPNDLGCEIKLINAKEAKEAHGIAADSLRANMELPSSTHVNTHTALKTADENIARVFFDRFMEKIEEMGNIQKAELK